jgi:hypothetical protein
MLMAPSADPKQVVLCNPPVTEIAGGSVSVKVSVSEHPLASVMSTEYVPALSPVSVAFVPPEGDHWYVNPPAQPLTMTIASPFAPPLQVRFVCMPVTVIAVGSVMLNVSVSEHPFASVIRTEYVPAVRPVAVAFVPPEGDHWYVYPPVPPLTITMASPFEPPLHETLVCIPEAVSAEGSVIETDTVTEHPFASVMMHV